jgi:hypothetical protein
MASLSRLVKKPVLEEKYETTPQSELNISIPESPEEKYKQILFLSDSPLTSTIKEQLRDFKNVREFDNSKMTNRTLDSLYEEHGIDIIWADLTKSDCRKWVASQLPKKSKYFKAISVYSHSKTAKWRSDVEKYCDHSCKLSNLKQQIMAISFKDLAENLDNIELHEIPNKLLSFCGLQNRLSKKKSYS